MNENGQCISLYTCFQLQSGTRLSDMQEAVVAKHAVQKPLQVVVPLQACQRMNSQWPLLGQELVMHQLVAKCVLTWVWFQASAAAEHAAERHAYAREVAELQATCARAAAGQAAALQEAALLRKQARAAQQSTAQVCQTARQCATPVLRWTVIWWVGNTRPFAGQKP